MDKIMKYNKYTGALSDSNIRRISDSRSAVPQTCEKASDTLKMIYHMQGVDEPAEF